MSEPTHRVVGGPVRQTHGDDYEVGDEVAPSESELRAFPDRFEPLAAERNQDRLDRLTSASAADELSTADAREVLADHGVDVDDYRALQQLAALTESVPGNLGKSELQRRLAALAVDDELPAD